MKFKKLPDGWEEKFNHEQHEQTRTNKVRS